jgi:hypothetical protein
MQVKFHCCVLTISLACLIYGLIKTGKRGERERERDPQLAATVAVSLSKTNEKAPQEKKINDILPHLFRLNQNKKLKKGKGIFTSLLIGSQVTNGITSDMPPSSSTGRA